MSFLLDAHAFLWSLMTPKKLGKKGRAILADNANTVLISSVTFWKISLKYALGKLELEGCEPQDLPDHAKTMRFETLPLSVEHATGF